MFSGYIEPTPGEPHCYRVVVRRKGEVVRVQPVHSAAEGSRTLAQLLRSERKYEQELQASLEIGL